MGLNEKKTVALLHTAAGIIAQLEPIIHELIPEIRATNILDERLLSLVRETGKMSSGVCRAVLSHVVSAEEMGASAVLVTCTSITECVDYLSRFVDIPVLRIEQPMIAEAVDSGERIGVVATLPSARDSIKKRLIEESRRRDKRIVIDEIKCEGAFDALLNGRMEEHDRCIVRSLERIEGKVDVVVLAQVSMERILSGREKPNLSVPILSCPRSGVEQLRRVL